jgi:hypothetical protein
MAWYLIKHGGVVLNEARRRSYLLYLTKHARNHPYFPGLVLPSGQKLTLGLLATITLEVAPFRSPNASAVF